MAMQKNYFQRLSDAVMRKLLHKQYIIKEIPQRPFKGFEQFIPKPSIHIPKKVSTVAMRRRARRYG